VNEFDNLQAILDTTEQFVNTPYIWGVYRILVMPPAFPMGGMSQPMLSYVSSTCIVGDKSQEYVLVRNVAQSWLGSQVTPNNWEDVWINEGFTTYVERMVQAQLWTYNFALTEAYVGNTSYASQVSVIGIQDQTYSTLHPVLHGDNPDNSFSIVPFEKGFQLLAYIEQSVLGDYPAMLDFITFYIESNNLMSICAFTERKTFSQFVESYYSDADQVNEILAMVDYEEWIYVVGTDPTNTLNFTVPPVTAALDMANAYIVGNGTSGPSNYADYNTWESNQKVVFHQTILWNINTNVEIMARIDSDLNVTAATDPEVRQRWYSLGLYLSYNPVYTPAQTWVSTMGRNKYLNSIYTALSESGQRNLGIQWYNDNIDFYSPTSKMLVSGILGI